MLDRSSEYVEDRSLYFPAMLARNGVRCMNWVRYIARCNPFICPLAVSGQLCLSYESPSDKDAKAPTVGIFLSLQVMRKLLCIIAYFTIR